MSNAKANESSGRTSAGVMGVPGIIGVATAGEANGSSSRLTVASSSVACSREAANPREEDWAHCPVMNLGWDDNGWSSC
jgi:hypothetical protein